MTTIETLRLVLLTSGIAVGATSLLILPGLAAAWWLSRPRSRAWPRGRLVLEVLVMLPLVLPPTALGLLLLLLVGHNGVVGTFFRETIGMEIAFTWKAAVLASSVVAFPLFVLTARSAFESIDPRLPAVARSLGRGPLAAFLEVELPMAWRGLLAAVVLAFARALGEFGATILVAGNIPGETQTLALAIFQHLQMGRDREALELAALSALLAALALLAAGWLARRRGRWLEG